jgi:hypothetical protein
VIVPGKPFSPLECNTSLLGPFISYEENKVL